MKTQLNRIIAGLLCLVLVAQAPAMANSSQPPAIQPLQPEKLNQRSNDSDGSRSISSESSVSASPANGDKNVGKSGDKNIDNDGDQDADNEVQDINGHGSRSEDARDLDRPVKESKIFNQTVVNGKKEDVELKEIFDLLQAETGLMPDEVDALINSKSISSVNSAAFHFFKMIAAAKRGLFVLAGSHRDYAIVQFAFLTDFIKESPKYTKKEIGPALMLAILRWSFAKVGPVTRAERDRVTYTLTEFTHTMANAKSNPMLRKLYRKDAAAMVTSTMYGFVGAFLIFTGAVVARTTWPESVLFEHAIAASLISFVPMAYAIYRASGAFFLNSRLKIFKKNKLDEAMASYLGAEFNPEIVRRIQSRAKAVKPSSAGDAADPIKQELKELTGEKLRDAILLPVSPHNKIQALFDAASDDQEATDRIDAMIAQDPELSSLAQRGRSFREFYRDSLKRTFGDAGAEFVTDPEIEILKELRMARNSANANKLQEIDLKRAEIKAWEETKARFGLSAEMEVKTLDEQRFSKPTYMAAYEYFRRAYFRAQHNETPRIASVELDLKKLKAKVSQETHKRRAENFIDALKTYKKLHPSAVSIKIRVGDEVATVAIEELLKSQIQFSEKPGYQLPIPETEPRLNDLWITQFSWDAMFAKKDISSAQEFYRLRPVSPTQMQHEVTFQTGDRDQKQMTISEASFSRLLFELGPKYAPLQNFEDNDERYLAEAARRDSILANAVTFIAEEGGNDLTSLEKRISQKIAERSRVTATSKTLSEELRDNPHVNKTSSLLNDLRWFGYAIHPDYWRVRDAEVDARKSEEAIIRGGTKDAKLKKKLKELNQKWDDIGKNRLSYKARVIYLVKLAARTAALTAFIYASFTGVGNKIVEALDVSVPTALLKKYDSELQQLQMDSADRATNHPKDLVDGDRARQPFFEILAAGPEHRPNYLNIADPLNLPKNLLEEEDRARYLVPGRIEYDNSIQQLHLTEVDLDDFIIRSLFPMVGKDNFLPLPSPNGYRIDRIQISVLDSRPNPKVNLDYKVYFDNRTGLSYVRFDKMEKGKFLVMAKYKPIEPKNEISDISWQLIDKSVAGKTNQDLIDLGATQLATAITKTLDEVSQPTVQNVAMAFTFSGKYTYDSESFSFRPWSSNPFESSRKFLRGDELFYQCTGSNRLLNKYLQTYYQQKKSDVEVQNLIGFTFNWGSRKVSSVGHMHTLVFKRSDAYQYVEIDGTPAQMDPKYANKAQPDAVQIQNESKSPQWYQKDKKIEKDRLAAKQILAPQGVDRFKSPSLPIPNPYALRPAPLRVVTNPPSAAARPTPPPKTEEPKDSDESDEKNKKPEETKPQATKPQATKPSPVKFALEGPEQARASFEATVTQLKKRIAALKEMDRSLTGPNVGRRPGIDDLVLLLSIRGLLAGELKRDQLLRQVLRLIHHLPMNRNLDPSEEEFLRSKAMESTNAANGKAAIALQTAVKTLKDSFNAAVDRERAKVQQAGKGGKKQGTSRTAYLLDGAFVQSMNQYYDFLLRTNLEIFAATTPSSANSLTCQNLFKK